MEDYKYDVIGYWEYDIQSKTIYLSAQICAILGVDIKNITFSGHKSIPFISKDDYPIILSKIKNAVNGQNQIFSHKIIGKESYVYQVKSDIGPIHDNNKSVTKIIGRTEVLNSTSVSADYPCCIFRSHYDLLLKNSFEVMQVINGTGDIRYISPNVEQILHRKPNDLIGRSLFEIVPVTELNNVKHLLNKVLNDPDKVFHSEIPLYHNNGTIIYVEVAVSNVVNTLDIDGILLNWKDITPLKNIQSEIEHISSHDYLTSLPNKRLFEKQAILQMHKAKDQSQSFAIMILDIDRFKHINDTLGHNIGDQLLKGISSRLIHLFKEYMKLYRFGGDEFAVLMPLTTDTKKSSYFGQQIISSLREPFKVDTHDIYITTSLGISIYPFDGDSFESLLKAAELAMYRAKEQGKNQYQLYSSTMDEESYRKFILGNHLNKALEKKELILYYQPQIDPETNRIKGAEALIRWNHPVWGIIPPLDFIHLAEETGLIIPIGEWVLQTACEQLKKWRNIGFDIQKISVNFSAVQFSQDNLVADILNVLSRYELAPNSLEIEITESILMENQDRILEKINRLIENGVHIAIDDFGTGYSSLGYLKEFRIDTLKIDKSFIKDIPTDLDSIALLTAIINLGKALKKNIIAEGVETGDQVTFLSGLKCNELQGFYFSKPVSAEEFEKYLH